MGAAKNPARILVVDDEDDVRLAAKLLLKRHFASVETLSDPARLPEMLAAHRFDVLLLDMNFTAGPRTGAEGLSWLDRVLAQDPSAAVVLVTARGDVDLAVQAMKRGAADFVTKPWENARLVATLTAAANLRLARSEAEDLRERQQGLAAATQNRSAMIGSSPAMEKVFALIRRAAPTEANVLILGENGTGKELVARELHRQSARADKVFVRVDLGAISPSLFESELFGHKRGAFTDAREDRAGLFRAATGGTLFLDEIGNVPLHLQAKLLTALERREVVPVGGQSPVPIDVRLIAATNMAPADLANPEIFRTDLLYRVNTVEIALPPLRERAEDIPLLAEHFIDLYARKYNMARKRISRAALDLLTHAPWPGNIRALRHAIERAVILSEGDMFEPADFPDAVRASPAPVPQVSAGNGVATVTAGPDGGPPPLEELEKEAIALALKAHGGNISHAARALGLTRASLYRRMEKYGF